MPIPVPGPDAPPVPGPDDPGPDEPEPEELTCSDAYPNAARQGMAWSARAAASAFGPLPNQTIGVLFTCDPESLAVWSFAGAQYDLTGSQPAAVAFSGMIPVYGPGHAEEKLIRNSFGEKLAIGTSNNVCPSCRGILSSSGATILPPFGADRGSKGAYWPAAE